MVITSLKQKQNNGDTTHYYKQVITRFVDKSGKDLVPSEKGKKR